MVPERTKSVGILPLCRDADDNTIVSFRDQPSVENVELPVTVMQISRRCVKLGAGPNSSVWSFVAGSTIQPRRKVPHGR